MTLEQINDILSHYSIGSADSFAELPSTTSGNTSYLVSTSDDDYVLRTLVRQSPEGATAELRIQQILNKNGVTTPLYIESRDGKVVVSAYEQHFVLSRRIPGSRQAEDTLRLAQDIGTILAKMHKYLGDLQLPQNRQQWFNPINAEDQLSRYVGPDKEFIEAKTHEYSSILDKHLPLALTHGDLHTNNIFSSDDRVTAVFDFESAEYTVRILDIARLYLTYIKVTDLEQQKVIAAILDGYNGEAELPLTHKEMSELTNAFVYVALVSSVSIYNHGNISSSAQYLEIAKQLIDTH